MSRSSIRRLSITRVVKSVGLGLVALVLAGSLAGMLAPQSAEAAPSTNLDQQLKELRADLKRRPRQHKEG